MPAARAEVTHGNDKVLVFKAVAMWHAFSSSGHTRNRNAYFYENAITANLVSRSLFRHLQHCALFEAPDADDFDDARAGASTGDALVCADA
jgi:hypothetical protein